MALLLSWEDKRHLWKWTLRIDVYFIRSGISLQLSAGLGALLRLARWAKTTFGFCGQQATLGQYRQFHVLGCLEQTIAGGEGQSATSVGSFAQASQFCAWMNRHCFVSWFLDYEGGLPFKATLFLIFPFFINIGLGN